MEGTELNCTVLKLFTIPGSTMMHDLNWVSLEEGVVMSKFVWLLLRTLVLKRDAFSVPAYSRNFKLFEP